ncbi:MAG: FIST C-terminal domain-containing protein [Candidatus Eisenbacteria bacterium]|nr:FIST C-terminal domain-containing protein [Candidatus Eisenbacteria bacterium]
MQVEQLSWEGSSGWASSDNPVSDADLVLIFGDGKALGASDAIPWLRHRFPKAQFFGCSTAGEILGTSVSDERIVATAVHFDRTTLHAAQARITAADDSFETGRRLAQSLPHAGLRHAFVLSDGLNVNGSELVRGLTSAIPSDVTVTGGLSGDGARFETTYVLWDDRPHTGLVAILGFYGSSLTVGYGSLGGWDPFGPERLITRSSRNILYELDGKSALKLYKDYLGDHAAGLPATGLLFPLSIRSDESATPIVRTILAVNEDDQSMTFAGDIPEGAYGRLMKANFDRLMDGAMGAAYASQSAIRGSQPELAILISCVGRKLILKQRVDEEVEGVRAVLGSGPALTGFYSYGEISPFTPSARCELHNQTMTITTLAEAA